MFNPFKHNRQTQPFLSPLGRRRRLPAAVAPLAVTAVGGAALVVAFGALIGGLVGGPPPDPAPRQEQAAAQAVEAPPAADSARAALTAPALSIAAEADPANTAAIELEPILPPPAAEVPVAESEADIAALEAAQDDALADDEPDTAAPQPDTQDGDEEPAIAQAASPELRGARVRQAVNLRAAPDNDGRVLMVVPSGAEVEAEDDCRWCAVRYRGSSGFVYKTFLDYR